MPTLALHGAHDPMASPEDLGEWLARIDNARRAYVRLPGADHNAQFSHARATLAREIVAFLRD